LILIPEKLIAQLSWEEASIAFVKGRQDSESYIWTLSEFLLSFAHLHHGTEFLFQHDNTSSHSSRATTDFLLQHDVQVMPWPALSPDLNPIENAWAHLSRKVYDNGRRQFRTVKDLEAQILASWEDMENEYFQTLVSSMTHPAVPPGLC